MLLIFSVTECRVICRVTTQFILYLVPGVNPIKLFPVNLLLFDTGNGMLG
jgi:hypothetical protein